MKLEEGTIKNIVSKFMVENAMRSYVKSLNEEVDLGMRDKIIRFLVKKGLDMEDVIYFIKKEEHAGLSTADIANLVKKAAQEKKRYYDVKAEMERERGIDNENTVVNQTEDEKATGVFSPEAKKRQASSGNHSDLQPPNSISMTTDEVFALGEIPKGFKIIAYGESGKGKDVMVANSMKDWRIITGVSIPSRVFLTKQDVLEEGIRNIIKKILTEKMSEKK